jgi:hypothetical protein
MIREQMHRFNELVEPGRERYPAVVVTPIFEAAKAGHALALHGGCAQLVALGSRRRDPLARSFFGSSSLNLIHHCQMPVVLCPSGTGLLLTPDGGLLRTPAAPADHSVAGIGN